MQSIGRNAQLIIPSLGWSAWAVVVAFTVLLVYLGAFVNWLSVLIKSSGEGVDGEFVVPPVSRFDLASISLALGGFLLIGLLLQRPVPDALKASLTLATVASLFAAIFFIASGLGIPLIQLSDGSWAWTIMEGTVLVSTILASSGLTVAMAVLLYALPMIWKGLSDKPALNTGPPEPIDNS